MEFEVIATADLHPVSHGEPVKRIVGAKSKATLLRELGYHVRYGQRVQRLSRGLSSAIRIPLWTRV
jgi:hypothetical protein